MRPDGTPVAGAELVLECPEPFRSKLAPLARAEADAQGRFALDCGRKGPFCVQATERVERQVKAQASRDDVSPGPDEFEIVLFPAIATGRVVDDLGRPVTDFRIAWTPIQTEAAGTPNRPGELVRNAGGEFTSELSPGAWRARIRASAPHVSASIELEIPTLEPVTVVLARKGVVRGTVLDPAGRPVAGAEVRGTEIGNWPRLDQDGRFEWRVPPGVPFSIWAEHEDFALSEALELFLLPGEERQGIVLQLGEPAHVTGEVIDPSGRPVSGREVRVFKEPAIGALLRDQGVKSHTDADGRFEVLVTPGPLFASVDLSDEELLGLGRPAVEPGYSRPSLTRAFTLGPGESAHVRLTMGGQPVRLFGRIEVGGEAPAWAHVRPRHWGGREVGIARPKDGHYEVLLPEPGTYTVGVAVEGAHYQPTIDVPEGDSFRFDLVLPIGLLAGHIRGPMGSPLEGVTVDAMSHGEGQPLRSSGRAKTDREGAYTLRLPGGLYQVSPREDFEKERSFGEPEPRIEHVDPDSETTGVDFELVPIGGIEGRVRLREGGALNAARVTARHGESGSVYSASVNDNGHFHLPLEEGRYWIEAIGSDGETTFSLPEPQLVALAPGAVQSLDLRLVAGTVVRVRLLAPEDEWPWIQMEALDGRGRSFVPTQRHEDLRVFLLSSPGPHRLRARHQGRIFEQALTLPVGEPELETQLRID